MIHIDRLLEALRQTVGRTLYDGSAYLRLSLLPGEVAFASKPSYFAWLMYYASDGQLALPQEPMEQWDRFCSLGYRSLIWHQVAADYLEHPTAVLVLGRPPRTDARGNKRVPELSVVYMGNVYEMAQHSGATRKTLVAKLSSLPERPTSLEFWEVPVTEKAPAT